MELSIDEQNMVDNLSTMLENRRSIAPLTTQEVSPYQLIQLFGSQKTDLALFGSYLLSMFDSSEDLSFLDANDESAKNYARVLLSQDSLDVAMDKVTPLGLDSVRSHLLALSLRIPSTKRRVSAPRRNSLTIIIHGTLASTRRWWRKGSKFWNFINSITKDVYAGPTPYAWTGQNSHQARVQAAKELIKWVNSNPCNELDIVAHSHGANICFLATRLGLKIRTLIALGTPIRLEYLPALREIMSVHNIFSTGDFVQTPIGTFPNKRGEGRTLGETQNVMNYHATDNGSGSSPSHSELHEELTWTACAFDKLLPTRTTQTTP